MKIEWLTLGELETNCYILYDPDTQKAVIVDPADEELKISMALTKMELKPEAILLTHGHFDHIMAADALRKRYGIPVYAGEKERELLLDPRKNLSGLWAAAYTLQADQWVSDGMELELAGGSIKVLETPGHTTGGVCYYVEKDQLLIAGDTLFYESYGRCDFPGGSYFALRKAIQQKLFVLPDETAVYPGHGGATTILHEKQCNPMK